MGRVLSQGEIDNMLANLLEDASVLPGSEPAVIAPAVSPEPAIPAGIAAFKAKIAAAQATRQESSDK